MSSDPAVNVLFVCLGNICRSPTAEGVFRAALNDAGLADWVGVDSAGTANYHPGRAPDPRAIEVATDRGVDITALRARQATVEDFERFDYVLAMDNQNHSDLAELGGDAAPGRLFRMLDFADGYPQTEVPDPYYGGDEGFALAINMIEAASVGLIAAIRRDHHEALA